MSLVELKDALASITPAEQLRLKQAFEAGETDYIRLKGGYYIGVNMAHLESRGVCKPEMSAGAWSSGKLM